MRNGPGGVVLSDLPKLLGQIKAHLEGVFRFKGVDVERLHGGGARWFPLRFRGLRGGVQLIDRWQLQVKVNVDVVLQTAGCEVEVFVWMGRLKLCLLGVRFDGGLRGENFGAQRPKGQGAGAKAAGYGGFEVKDGAWTTQGVDVFVRPCGQVRAIFGFPKGEQNQNAKQEASDHGGQGILQPQGHA